MAVLYFIDAGRTDIAYSESPSRTTIVSSAALHGLQVSFNGRPLEGAVSGVKLLIWNRGNREVAPEHVLEQFRIVSTPPVHILEVRVERQSRRVLGFGCFPPRRGGEIPLGWRILERGDAVVLNIVYEGARDAQFRIAGAVIGQREPNRRPYGSWAAPGWRYYVGKLWPSAVLLFQAVAIRQRAARVISLLGAVTLAIIGLWSLGAEWLFAAPPAVPF